MSTTDSFIRLETWPNAVKATMPGSRYIELFRLANGKFSLTFCRPLDPGESIENPQKGLKWIADDADGRPMLFTRHGLTEEAIQALALVTMQQVEKPFVPTSAKAGTKQHP